MAYTDPFNVGLDNLVASLGTITGLRVVDDPKFINPPCVFVDAPSFTAYNFNIAEMDVPVQIIGVVPADLNGLRAILANVAKVLAHNVAVTDGQPALFSTGGQDFAAYNMTVKMKVQGTWPS